MHHSRVRRQGSHQDLQTQQQGGRGQDAGGRLCPGLVTNTIFFSFLKGPYALSNTIGIIGPYRGVPNDQNSF